MLDVHAGEGARARLLAELPVVQRRLWVAGVSTSILEGGSGPPLVLLHGGTACGGVAWGPVVSGLAGSHRLVIPDIPGLGESKPVARLDAAFNTWFARLLDLTCQERPTVVADALSGGLAAGFAVRFGDLLSRLVIYGSSAVGPHRNPAGLPLAAIRCGLRASVRNKERLSRWFLLDPDKTRRQDRPWHEALNTDTRARASLDHVRRTMDQLIKSPAQQISETDLGRITVPTSLLWGRDDRVVPLYVAAAASRRFGWPLQVIDDAGNLAHVEQPESFVRALRNPAHSRLDRGGDNESSQRARDPERTSRPRSTQNCPSRGCRDLHHLPEVATPNRS